VTKSAAAPLDCAPSVALDSSAHDVTIRDAAAQAVWEFPIDSSADDRFTPASSCSRS
jgi:hypothetical protein